MIFNKELFQDFLGQMQMRELNALEEIIKGVEISSEENYGAIEAKEIMVSEIEKAQGELLVLRDEAHDID